MARKNLLINLTLGMLLMSCTEKSMLRNSFPRNYTESKALTENHQKFEIVVHAIEVAGQY